MTMVMNTLRTLIMVILALTWGQLSWAEDTETTVDEVVAEDSASGEKPILNEDHPDSYVVIKGDTLWDISNRFLSNPWMWPEIWHVNPQIANPHLIFPGDTIKLIYLEGAPKLTVKRGAAGLAYTAADQYDSGVGQDGDLTPRVRVLPLEEPIPAIPLDIIDPFLTGTRIVQAGVLEGAPYVVQGSQRHVISGAGSELYARGNFDDEHIVYGFFRKGTVYKDPKTNEVLGVQASDVGTGKMKSKEKDIARLSVVRAPQEIRPGDYLLTDMERRVDSIFYPSAPEHDINGEIIDVEGGVTQIGAMSVVLINKGEREGLASGNILAIFQKGELVLDPKTEKYVRLPPERAGLMMIFAPFEKMSYGLVLFGDRPMTVGDLVRQP